MSLSTAPHSVVRDGAPATGTYTGSPERIDWRGLAGAYERSALWRYGHHKRWHYVAIATEQCFIGLAIVNVGWTNTAFAYVFDREDKRLLLDYAQDGLPGLTAHVSDHPTVGTASWFKHVGASIRFAHAGGDRYGLAVDVGRDLKIQAEIDLPPGSTLLTAIGPIGPGGCAHATVKSSALPVRGQATAMGKTFDLGHGTASFDYSNGLLARNTQWRWASVHTPSIGLNLQQGYFGKHENVLWLDGEMIALGNAQFTFDPAQPLEPWHIQTDDGLVDLVFTPEGARQARKNLIVAASYYIQPIGTFSGAVRAAPSAPVRQVSRLLGVTEDHQSRW